ncbi:hypothetical protein BLNAU_5997 [Blattamonas nauphoetae]|uniref:Uncharacterized protein n=1 Tax=Blattamonas nauphoetae TaxID=2049346 RepID=A0ABQ9Y5G4_9EUKA|nr:hypothetical protein BLNAU_5997 [Blattamonas nauphoetae]
MTPHCHSSPSPVAMDALSAATAPPSSSLQSDALCLHNPTDALSIDTLFVSLEHRQILADSQLRMAGLAMSATSASQQSHSSSHPHTTPNVSHLSEHAQPHPPLTSSMLTPTLTLSSDTSGHPNAPNSMRSHYQWITFVFVSSSSESCTFRFSITAGFLPTHSQS